MATVNSLTTINARPEGPAGRVFVSFGTGGLSLSGRAARALSADLLRAAKAAKHSKWRRATDRAWFALREMQKLRVRFPGMATSKLPPGFGYQPHPVRGTPHHPPRAK